MNEYLELFLTFAKMGVMTFGGGMAMLPILQREVVEDRHWATEEGLVGYYALRASSPSTPPPLWARSGRVPWAASLQLWVWYSRP